MHLLARIGTTLAVLVLGVLALAIDLTVGLLTNLKSGSLEIAKAVKECWL